MTGAVLFLVALLVSLGAALAAPLGMWLVRRWTARHNRRRSFISSLVGAVLATAVASAVVLLVIFTVMPGGLRQELQRSNQEARAKPAKLPDWYTRMFPQAERTDSATKELMKSPGFTTVSLIFGGAMACLFLGVLGGTLGWGGASLLAFAWRGPQPPDSPPGHPVIPMPQV